MSLLINFPPAVFNALFAFLALIAFMSKFPGQYKFLFYAALIPILTPGIVLGIIPGILGLIAASKQTGKLAGANESD